MSRLDTDVVWQACLYGVKAAAQIHANDAMPIGKTDIIGRSGPHDSCGIHSTVQPDSRPSRCALHDRFSCLGICIYRDLTVLMRQYRSLFLLPPKVWLPGACFTDSQRIESGLIAQTAEAKGD